MNRKTLALLLLIPMMVFIVDQAFGIGTLEGGKEKKKGQTEAQAPIQQAVPSPESARVVEAASAAEMASSLEKTLQKSQSNLYDRFETMEFRYAIEEMAGPATSDFLNENVLEVLKEVDPCEVNMKEWFSRCGTRYNYAIYTDAKGEMTNEGEMIISRGCSEASVGLFRYDMAAQSVEAFVSEEHGYLPLKKYLQVYQLIES